MAALPPEMESIIIAAEERRWEEVLAKLTLLDGYRQQEWSRLLIRLAEQGGTAWLSIVISKGADPSFRDDDGETPLSACLNGSNRRRGAFGTFVRLLNGGADPNGICRGGNRPLQLVILENRPEFAGALLAMGANPELTSPDPNQPNSFDTAHTSGREWAQGVLERWKLERLEN